MKGDLLLEQVNPCLCGVIRKCLAAGQGQQLLHLIGRHERHFVESAAPGHVMRHAHEGLSHLLDVFSTVTGAAVLQCQLVAVALGRDREVYGQFACVGICRDAFASLTVVLANTSLIVKDGLGVYFPALNQLRVWIDIVLVAILQLLMDGFHEVRHRGVLVR